MKCCLSRGAAIAALGVAAVSMPLAGLIAPAVSRADDGCGAGMYWDIYAEQCLYYDPTVWVDPNPIVGPVGPVGVGGVGGPVGVGGPAGPGGPGGPGGPAGPGRPGIGR